MSSKNIDINASPNQIMRSIIQRIATGPELSKEISLEEARHGIRAVLNDEVDLAQAAVFLIALRMKRETDDEFKGVLDGIRDVIENVTVDVDELLDLSDPYNGYNRSLPAAPFLPCVLAACGVPVVSHGVERVSPKFGITHRLVLEAAGVEVNLSPQQAALRIADANTGWSYLDQDSYCPQLHKLVALRESVVKRQILSTVEVLTKPLQAKNKTHIMTGYVHKPYTRVYAMLARHAGFDSCLVVRGIEGGIIPSLRQKGRMFYYHDMADEQSQEFDPTALGIEQSVRATPLPDDLPHDPTEISADFDVRIAAQRAAEAGISALQANPGPTYDALVYAGALALWHLKKHDDINAAADQIRSVIDDGRALKHLQPADQ